MKFQSLSLALLSASLALPVLAQPDTQNAPKTQNPDNRPARPNFRNMTPEQRQQFLVQAQKRQWERYGITDDATQTLLANFVTKETTEQEKLREKGRELSQSLRAATATDTQIAGLLNNYNALVEENNERRKTAIADLKKAIDLGKYPKVEAVLTLGGFIGDGPAVNAAGGGRGGLGILGNMGGRNRQNQNDAAGANGGAGAGADMGAFAPGGNGGGNQNRNRNRNRPNAIEAPAAAPQA